MVNSHARPQLTIIRVRDVAKSDLIALKRIRASAMAQYADDPNYGRHASYDEPIEASLYQPLCWWMAVEILSHNRASDLDTLSQAVEVVGFAAWTREFPPGEEKSARKALSILGIHDRWSKLSFYDKCKQRLRWHIHHLWFSMWHQDEEDEDEDFHDNRSEHYWHLQELAVDPSYQRNGCGTALLQWGLANATRESLPVTLHATPQGRQLYAKSGFVTYRLESMADAEEHHGRESDLMIWSPPIRAGEISCE